MTTFALKFKRNFPFIGKQCRHTQYHHSMVYILIYIQCRQHRDFITYFMEYYTVKYCSILTSRSSNSLSLSLPLSYTSVVWPIPHSTTVLMMLLYVPCATWRYCIPKINLIIVNVNGRKNNSMFVLLFLHFILFCLITTAAAAAVDVFACVCV